MQRRSLNCRTRFATSPNQKIRAGSFFLGLPAAIAEVITKVRPRRPVVNFIRHTKLLVLVSLSTLCGTATSFAQSAPALAALTPSMGTVRPTGTFRGGLDIIACSGPGCRGGILATFTHDGHVKLMWKSE